MVSLVAILVWRLPLYVVAPVFLVFCALDGAYMTSVLTKVPTGAWFTIMLAFILSSIFILWRFGKEAQWAAESQDRLEPSMLLDNSSTSAHPQGTLRLTPAFGELPVSTVPGLGIFFDKAGDLNILPPSFTHFVRKFASRPSVVIFFHMRPLPVPTIPLAERYVISRTPGTLLTSCYSVVLRHGYADDVLRPGMARDLVAQIELALSRNTRRQETDGSGVTIASELETLREAALFQTVYVLGKEVMRVHRPASGNWKPWNFVRALFLELYLWIRENSRTKLADLDIDVDRLVEVGFLKEI